MNVSETTSTRVLTTKELVSRFHSHQDVHLSSVAPQFNTGVIDVELLKSAENSFNPRGTYPLAGVSPTNL